MSENNEEVIRVLDDLLRINNDRITIYEKAIKEIHEHDLKQVFQRAVDESKRIGADLGMEIFKRDSMPNVEATSIAGKIYMIWLEIKATFIGKDHSSILDACAFVEYSVQNAYKQALQHEGIELDLSTLIHKQKESLRISHIGVKTCPNIRALVYFN